jgi:hypothetical protein
LASELLTGALEVVMLVRSLGGVGTVALVLFALVAHQLGWVDGGALGRAGAVLALVVGLVGVVRLPWDLVFEARNVLARQESSRRRGLEVDAAEVAFARASAGRALVLAVGLHALGAVLAIFARGFVGDELGLVLAVAFAASMALRPIHAFYVHTRMRLGLAAREAEVPRQDALSLAESIQSIERRLRELDETREAEPGAPAPDALRDQLAVIETRARQDAGAWRKSAAVTDEKLDRVLRELERTVERTQQSAEVLAGIRAFVRLVRES